MKEILKLTDHGLLSKKNRPLIISGPCSAETEKQVMETAHGLAEAGIRIFRAGIWKPRTRPDTFEGMGSVALPWLKRVKEETGMMTATEVANVWHVRESLKHDVDILWIGARTTANPFAVQEIADAVRGLDIPVFVKNPVNPDIELWIGALERLNNAGITKLLAVHRGFSNYGESPYRNLPQWEIPIELKRRFPDLPIITDPSHICGNRELLFNISQTAMDLDFDGLFIESHFDPESALSDKNQQVTPLQLQQLLERLILRNPEIGISRQNETIEELRRQIDQWDDELLRILRNRMSISEKIGEYKKRENITILQTGRWSEILETRLRKAKKIGLSDQWDDELLRILRNRMSISEKIGEYKKRENITILQTGRWSEILETRLRKAKKIGLSDQFIIQVFKQIHQESINFQNRVMN